MFFWTPQSLLCTFDKIQVLDLHRNVKKSDLASDGSKGSSASSMSLRVWRRSAACRASICVHDVADEQGRLTTACR